MDQIAEDTGNPVEPVFVPVSALEGDNIVHGSEKMPWYGGPSLLELLESLPSSLDTSNEPFRFPVQRVLRPDHTFRGFAGQIASGTIRTGNKITVLPSGRSAEIERIVTWDGDLAEAHAPLSVTLVLNHELDISRGDLIVAAERPASVVKNVKAALVWMDQRPLERSRRYLLKHTSQTAPAIVSGIEHRTNISTLSREPAETLEMNGIGVVSIRLLRPIALDLYRENRSTGAFILIDPQSNSTVAAGMVIAGQESADSRVREVHDGSTCVSAEERATRWGHRGGALSLSGPAVLIDAIERSLFTVGAVTSRVDVDDSRFADQVRLLDLVVQSNVQSGFIVLAVTATDGDVLVAQVEEQQLTLDAEDQNSAVYAVLRLLEQTGILHFTGKVSLQ